MADKKEGLRILIVEDNPGDYTLICDFLMEKLKNPLIFHAQTLAGAAELTHTSSPLDVILLDLSLSDSCGENLVKEIIRLGNGSPVIVFTGHTDQDFGIRTLAWGVSDYLLKDELTAAQLEKSIAYSIERNRIYSRLEESEQKYRNLFELSPVPMWVFDPLSYRFLRVNQAARDHYGYTEEEFLSMSIMDIRPAEDIDLIKRKLEIIHSSRPGDKVDRFFRHLKKNGDLIIVEINSIYIEFEGKRARLVLANDITEKVEAQEALKESERKFRLLVENGVDRIAIFDQDANYLFKYPANSPSLLSNTQKASDNLFDYVHPEDKDKVSNQFSKIFSGLTVNIFPYRFKEQGSEWIWVETTLTNRIEDPSIKGIVGNSRDVSERKRAEMQMQESQENLHQILQALEEVVWAANIEDRKLLFVSNSLNKVFGIQANELNRNIDIWKTLIHPDDKAKSLKIDEDLINYGKSQGVYRIIDSAGNIKWIENTSKIIKGYGNKPSMIIGSFINVTEKVLAEQEAMKAREEAGVAIRSVAELELRTLQLQMNPHFIFNALNSIQSYVMSKDLCQANTYLTKFAQLIRLFLDSSRNKYISIREEIRLLSLYIDMEKLRFDQKFDYEIKTDADVDKFWEIPTMILQPFVENAINHGLRYKKSKGKLLIHFYCDSSSLLCSIEDDGVGRDNARKIQSLNKKGYQSQGLKITTERLITYSEISHMNIEFSIDDKTDIVNGAEDVGTRVLIRFPVDLV